MESDEENLPPEITQTGSPNVEIPYELLIEFIESSNFSKKSTALKDHLCSFICRQQNTDYTKLSNQHRQVVFQKVKKFLSTFNQKLTPNSRHIEKVLGSKDDWVSRKMLLDQNLFLKTDNPRPSAVEKKEKSKHKQSQTSNTKRRSKFRAAKELRKKFTPEVIHLAAGQTLSQAGRKNTRFVFQKINSTTGLTAAKIRKSIEDKGSLGVTQITSAEGLAFLLFQNLTKAQYNAIRTLSKSKGADIWPPYYKIREAKQECRPDHIELKDHEAIVPMQGLLHHTTHRILAKDPKIEEEMIKMARENNNELKVTLLFKYGFDGSGSHHRHMQPDGEGDHPEVKCLVATQMVPLQLSTDFTDQFFPETKLFFGKTSLQILLMPADPSA